MSMDVIVWASCALTIPADLPEAEKWETHSFEDSTYWTYQSPNFDWQLVIEDPNGVPVPVNIKEIAPDTSHGYLLVLEPISAPKKGYQLQHDAMLKILAKCNGALVQDTTGLNWLDEKGSLRAKNQ